ncbi:phosphatidate cytidylyltransferase [Candidatus Puniceispirillum sp.]|nr:phosphatidate cytidylyltransferase [Candidatus Puniceispirillum sp.]
MGLSKSSVTIRRVFGAMLLLPVVFAVWYDQRIGGLMVLFLTLFMTLEAKRLTNMPPITGYLVVGLIMAQAIPYWVIDRPVELAFGFALLAVVMVLLHTKNIIVALFTGLLSICFGYASLLLTQPSGHIMLVALAAIIAACDSAAYFVGRRFGGPKLWPQVSPSKTISGSIGGLGAAIALTLVLADVIGLADQLHALILGLVLGILAQAGDLLESAIKRRLNVKDSGSILPGHGGMLDRFDGYILAIPAFYLYLFEI